MNETIENIIAICRMDSNDESCRKAIREEIMNYMEIKEAEEAADAFYLSRNYGE